MDCIHRWRVDNHNTGTCSLCGEVRQFPWDKKSPVTVLKRSILVPVIKKSRCRNYVVGSKPTELKIERH